MEDGEETELRQMGLTSSQFLEYWNQLSPENKIKIRGDFNHLHQASLLDEDIAFLILRHRLFSTAITRLLIILKQQNIPHKPLLSSVESLYYVADELCDLIVSLNHRFKMNESRVTKLLLTQEPMYLVQAVDLLATKNLLNERRLDLLLSHPKNWALAYAEILEVLWMNRILLATEGTLSAIEPENISDINHSLRLISEKHRLSELLLDALINNQKYSQYIDAGLRELNSRLPRYTIDQAITVIGGEQAAKALAVCLAFLTNANTALNTTTNRERLLQNKKYLEVLGIMLYQLKCCNAISQDNFIRSIEVSPLLMDPILLKPLKEIPFHAPLLLPRIESLYSKLSALNQCIEEGERESLLFDCVQILTGSSASVSKEPPSSSSASFGLK